MDPFVCMCVGVSRVHTLDCLLLAIHPWIHGNAYVQIRAAADPQGPAGPSSWDQSTVQCIRKPKARQILPEGS